MSSDDRGADSAPDPELEALLASLNADDIDLTDPPESVWNRISAAIADKPTHAEQAIAPSGNSATVSTITKTSRPVVQWRWLAVAAGLLLAVAGVTTWLSTRSTRSNTRVVATAQLVYETGFDQAGASAAASADLLERDGTYLISLQDSALPTELGEPADLELWLIEADADGNLDVQPVAIIDQGDGTYAVPAGLNPRTHNIVDISIEPRDGDKTHSGRSILRGPLVEV